MIRSLALVVGLTAVLTGGMPTGVTSQAASAEAPTGSFELVGHDPLRMRGMNAALAIHGDHAYVGSRTDAKPNNVNGAGILVVNIADPASPEVVGEIAQPHQANEGETSREMRVWPEQDLLIVQNLGSNCSELIHACSPRKVDDNFRFYDISGANAASPKLVAEFDPTYNPHEFFLWDDPVNPGRALLFVSAVPDRRVTVIDISHARTGTVTEVLSWKSPVAADLHSLGVSNDGKRAYIAHLTGGFIVVDTSDVATNAANPTFRPITPTSKRVKWDGPGAHSAVKLFGREYALVTDEVYGDALRPPVQGQAHGCPWGWVRMVDINDPAEPKVISEYKIAQNEAECPVPSEAPMSVNDSGKQVQSYACASDALLLAPDQPRPSSSYASHNPTLTQNVAFISWHSGGLQAISLADPFTPTQLAEFIPSPELLVVQEDPALTAGQDKVAIWSYPIIKDGLIYVVDIRNGLYILKYSGQFEEEVSGVDFIEGNSNLGDALKFEPV